MAATEKLAMLGGRSVRTAPCRSLLKVDALTAVEAIKAEGVAATPRYPTPLPLQKVFREKIGYGGTDCPYGCRRYGREQVRAVRKVAAHYRS